jgi:STE24 endopeptidase
MERAARNRSAKPGGLGILAAAGAALTLAIVAAWLMAPETGISPAAVDASDWFDAEFLSSSTSFRDGQRWLYVCQLLAQTLCLLALVLGPLSKRLCGLLTGRAATRPALYGVAVAASLLLALQTVGLPFAIASHERAAEVGLSTQGFGAWFVDWLLATVIFVAIGSAILMGALWLARRFGARWWIPGAAGVIATAVLITWAGPAVLSPIFNDYQELEEGPARTDVLRLAEVTGVDVGGIYRVDASRRTSGINAFVDGIGNTKRVVLYDTLIAGLPANQRRSVIAHELAHAERNDLWRGLLWVAIVCPLAVLFVALMGDRLAPGRVSSRGLPEALPALVLAIAIAITFVQTVGNGLSRAVERNADVRALELTDSPGALIGLQRRLAETNLTQPDPPGWSQFLFGTHPTTDQRIGLALSWKRGERPR